MRVAIASDHRGFKLKNDLINFLKVKGYEVFDCGTYSQESCDYPDCAYLAADSVRNKKAERAIVICYTGIGSAIAANKVKGIRAALVYDLKSAYLSRRHNDSNVMVLPAYLFKLEYLEKLVLRWLKEGFEGGRHVRRIKKIQEIEERENA